MHLERAFIMCRPNQREDGGSTSEWLHVPTREVVVVEVKVLQQRQAGK